MSNKKNPISKKRFTPDWFVRGVLTKLGEAFDRLTGRNWKPSSNLATSEIIQRLKLLLDAEAKDLGAKGKFVPHNIQLKMQWDKFSADSEAALKKLEYELLTAAVDHINDNLYHTFAPLKIEIKTDYFTEGVKLQASYENFAEDEREFEFKVEVPDLKNVVIAPGEEKESKIEKEIFAFEFKTRGITKKVELAFSEKERLSVGRTKENNFVIDDASVSKIHAALVLNSDKQLMVADTGSTNGTFINGQRIAYGKACAIKSGDKLKFGTINVSIEHSLSEVEEKSETSYFSLDKEVSEENKYQTEKENLASDGDSDLNTREVLLDLGENNKEIA